MSVNFPPVNDKYQHILELEWEAQGALGVAECQLAGVPLYRKEQTHQAYRRAKADERAAVAALTFDELCEFKEYRDAVLACYAQLPE
jgi:hypothetical protein